MLAQPRVAERWPCVSGGRRHQEVGTAKDCQRPQTGAINGWEIFFLRSVT